MDLGLRDKTAIVMASSGGLGKGIATELAREGAKVMLFSPSEEKLAEAQRDIEEETGNRPSFFVGDITAAKDIKGLVDATVEKLGPVYALVNNTGGPPAGTFDDFEDTAWQKAFELTLLSYIRTVRAVLPSMRGNGGGRIVNSTSSSVKSVLDNLILSNTFRTGVMGLTKSLSQELGKDGILVNVIGPGRIGTARIEHLDSIRAERSGLSVEEVRRKAFDSIPLGRYGTVDEYGRLAAFLCSEANTYITGQTILLDGGMVKAF
ncbi:short-chain dehydrogenase/reductase SDR [Dethiosulfovibrio peptidovorans DSM 11002]|uniref:Short-chain dehydrogenase/reductase SDR n=1 Tax=Dethiosulfovibrio peptidovorans DSM 11002 TaxID=469381 RepID=D2Z711_9BACT|nr:SDR family oxidoreductase [Dethiosulfovibrio peptidovorans]EFC91258.1 short-chain dehydrogenase/reductase SDR [Dethiosulfovibrio peptidovorans DSM 11002]